MIKYDLEHSGSGPGGMSVAEAIECAYHVYHVAHCTGCPEKKLNRKALGVLAVAWIRECPQGHLGRFHQLRAADVCELGRCEMSPRRTPGAASGARALRTLGWAIMQTWHVVEGCSLC